MFPVFTETFGAFLRIIRIIICLNKTSVLISKIKLRFILPKTASDNFLLASSSSSTLLCQTTVSPHASAALHLNLIAPHTPCCLMRGLDSTYLLQSPVEVTLSSLSQTHCSIYGSLWFNRGSPGLLTDAEHKHSHMRKQNFQTPTYTHFFVWAHKLTNMHTQTEDTHSRENIHAENESAANGRASVLLTSWLLSVVCCDVVNRERFEGDQCQFVGKRYKDESNMPCVITGRNLKNAVIWTETDNMRRASCG